MAQARFFMKSDPVKVLCLACTLARACSIARSRTSRDGSTAAAASGRVSKSQVCPAMAASWPPRVASHPAVSASQSICPSLAPRVILFAARAR